VTVVNSDQVLVSGKFTTAGSVTSPFVAMYSQSSNTWSALPGTTGFINGNQSMCCSRQSFLGPLPYPVPECSTASFSSPGCCKFPQSTSVMCCTPDAGNSVTQVAPYGNGFVMRGAFQTAGKLHDLDGWVGYKPNTDWIAMPQPGDSGARDIMSASIGDRPNAVVYYAGTSVYRFPASNGTEQWEKMLSSIPTRSNTWAQASHLATYNSELAVMGFVDLGNGGSWDQRLMRYIDNEWQPFLWDEFLQQYEFQGGMLPNIAFSSRVY
jgi:hypothetical protein